MNEHFYAVIMAGGGGTRLWPLSRHNRPKQLLKIRGERSLFLTAVDRLNGLFPPERILVVTVAGQAKLLKKEFPDIPKENYLLEPMPRGTASVVGLAAVVLQKRDPFATMAVLTADHFIENVGAFQKLLSAGCGVAQLGYLVTLGIKPSYPSSGYGYIQRGEQLGVEAGVPFFKVARFKEKPDEAQARAMISGGDHDWNSGMFIWRVDRILEEFRTWMPDLFNSLEEIQNAWGGPSKGKVLQRNWTAIQPQTIDYGIMENAGQVACLSGEDLGWNDVGSFESFFEVLASDEEGNVLAGSGIQTLDTKRCLIISEKPDKLIASIGLTDVIVVNTADAILICSRSQAQKVREMVNRLKESGLERYI